MRIAVKICGLTRAPDVRAAIDAGADAIGIVFDRGPRKVGFSTAVELLAEAQGASIERVAVVGTAGAEERASIAALGFDLIQAVATPERGSHSNDLIPVFFDSDDLEERVSRWRETQYSKDQPDCALQAGSLRGTINIDGAGGGGTGTRADWTRVTRVGRAGAITLSGGLKADNLEQALRMVRPHAVDVSSGVEVSAGRKDAQKMLAFVQEVRRLEALISEAV